MASTPHKNAKGAESHPIIPGVPTPLVPTTIIPGAVKPAQPSGKCHSACRMYDRKAKVKSSAIVAALCALVGLVSALLSKSDISQAAMHSGGAAAFGFLAAFLIMHMRDSKDRCCCPI